MRKSHVYLACYLLGLCSMLAAQDRDLQLLNRYAKGKDQVKPDEIVSFKSDYSYSKAILNLSDMAKKFTGKIIVDTSPIKNDDTKTIGTNIESMYWKDALEVILKTNDNWYEEDPQYFLIYGAKEGKKDVSTAVAQAAAQQQGAVQAQAGQAVQQPPIDSAKVYAQMREVVVSAILLQVNQTKLHENGISFSIHRGSDVNLDFSFSGAAKVTNQIFNGQVAPKGSNMTVGVTAAIAFFEDNTYGEIVSRPVVRVRAGGSSIVQIGSSISILTRDFSNNTVQTFVDAGVILQVSPRVYNYNGVDFIDLHYNVDKSSPNVSATGTSIDHNKVSGTLLMLDGERTYVSGLITSVENTSRSGVPILKDLPWWVFGLRYIFGYTSVSENKTELIIIIEAKLEPPVEERAAANAIGTQKSQMEKARLLREETDKLLKKDH
jgi:type IV pilus assembly protein PilQ